MQFWSMEDGRGRKYGTAHCFGQWKMVEEQSMVQHAVLVNGRW